MYHLEISADNAKVIVSIYLCISPWGDKHIQWLGERETSDFLLMAFDFGFDLQSMRGTKLEHW